MTRNWALLALLLFLLMATAGAVWQFGPYGLYGGAFVGALALTFIEIEKKGGEDDA
ncbi:hypothetical protein ACWD2L_05870 [Streptomyces sp. NPDC002754]